MKGNYFRIILAVILVLSLVPAGILSIVTSNKVAHATGTPVIVVWNTTPAGGTWTVPNNVTLVSVLVVGGGGGGGSAYGAASQNRRAGGGGGAGGYQTNTSYTVTPGASVTVTVGTGGASGTWNGSEITDSVNGTASVFGTITANGGGFGGSGRAAWTNLSISGRDGGSGGGEGVPNGVNNGVFGYGSQGNNGGTNYFDGTITHSAAGGGGGASEIGSNAGSTVGGKGGNGSTNSISGSSVTYAGGGGGGTTAGTVGGAGTGGGGAGGNNGGAGVAGTDGLGGGGGGGGSSVLVSAYGGKGGNGSVIISYLIVPLPPTSVAATDGTSTTNTTVTWTKSTGATGYYVYNASTLLATLGDVATYNDSTSNGPTITGGTATASDGTSSSYVTLNLSGTSASSGISRTYKVVAFNDSGYSGDSNTDTGFRGTATLTYQWQRSAADSNAAYSDIASGTTSPYNDTGAPADGSGRYFQCNISMPGATSVNSSNDRGYRSVSATISISNLPTTWTINSLTGNSHILTSTTYYSNPLGDTITPPATVNDSSCYFTVTNSSNVAIDLTVTFGNFSGGDAMINGNTGSAGATTFGAYSWYSGMTYTNKVIAKDIGSAVLYSNFTGSTLKWGAEISTRTTAWASGTDETATITITATQY